MLELSAHLWRGWCFLGFSHDRILMVILLGGITRVRSTVLVPRAHPCTRANSGLPQWLDSAPDPSTVPLCHTPHDRIQNSSYTVHGGIVLQGIWFFRKVRIYTISGTDKPQDCQYVTAVVQTFTRLCDPHSR